VTLALALAGGACSEAHTPPDGPDGEERPTVTLRDGGAGTPGLSDGPLDRLADAGSPTAGDAAQPPLADCDGLDSEDWTACCSEAGWPCDWETGQGCCAWGPYVPPGDTLPPSRSVTQRVLA